MIGVSIFKSDAFKNIFGEDSELFAKLRKQFEYEYRHGLSGRDDQTDNSYGGSMKAFFRKVKTQLLVQSSPILKNNKKCQSLAEFILTFGIVCIVVILFVKLAFNYTKGYIIHYVTYMASRSYMVQDNNSGTPETTDNDAKTIAINSVYRKIFNEIPTTNIKTLNPAGASNKIYIGIKTSVLETFHFLRWLEGEEK